MQTSSSLIHFDSSQLCCYLRPMDLSKLALAVAPINFENSSEQEAELKLIMAPGELDQRCRQCRHRSDQISYPRIAPAPVL